MRMVPRSRVLCFCKSFTLHHFACFHVVDAFKVRDLSANPSVLAVLGSFSTTFTTCDDNLNRGVLHCCSECTTQTYLLTLLFPSSDFALGQQ